MQCTGCHGLKITHKQGHKIHDLKNGNYKRRERYWKNIHYGRITCRGEIRFQTNNSSSSKKLQRNVTSLFKREWHNKDFIKNIIKTIDTQPEMYGIGLKKNHLKERESNKDKNDSMWKESK